jgi:riboflavin transporter FmnP
VPDKKSDKPAFFGFYDGGELANFLIGVCFVAPAGLIYRYWKSKKGAVIGSVIGVVLMAVASIPINYYITYPIYAQIFAKGDMNVIIGMYTALYPGMDTLMKALVYCNMPFTLAKGLLDFIITLLIYKHISPLLKGEKR